MDTLIYDKYINDKLLADNLCEYYKTHTVKETLEEFLLPNGKLLRKILIGVGFDINYKKHNNPLKGRPSTRTHESYVLGGVKSAETQRQYWDNLDKEEWGKKQSLSHKTLQYRELAKQNYKSYWESLSESQKQEINQKRSDSMKKYWQQLSPDRLVEISDDRRVSAYLMWESLTEDLRVQRIQNSLNSHTFNHCDSGPNLRFKQLLDAYNILYDREFVVGPYAYDFKVGNNLVEINPTYTHNSTFGIYGKQGIDKKYHHNKSKVAEANGFRCIHVWDWDNPELIIKLLRDREKIMARKCLVREIDQADAELFINLNHLQGYVRDNIRIGLFYNDILVSVMTFGKPRYNKNYDYELLRYCSTYNVVGGAEKIFNYFRQKYSGAIISYCDRSKFSGYTYEKLGFKLLRSGSGSIHWYNIKTKQHITDNTVRKLGADKLLGTNFGKGTSNNQILILSGFVLVYDAGQSTYVIVE